MTGYLLRRLVYAVFVVWGAVSIIFVVVRLLPGDPIRLLSGPDTPAETIERIRAEYGLDDPIAVQYLEFIGGAIRLDFGPSIYYGGSAIDQVIDRMAATAVLAVAAMALALLVSFPLGVIAARRRRRLADRVISNASLIAQALPPFWTGIILILLFSRRWQLLPSGGDGGWRNLVLPSITLGLPLLGILVRLVRGGLLEVLGEGYVQTARAKGLSERVVVYRHALRNSLIPVLTVVGLQFGAILGGTVIVETVFAWPGIGRLLVSSIFGRDFAVVTACTFFIAVVFVVMNLVVDLAYVYLDPRIRVEAT